MTATLAAALVEAQKQMPGVEKTATAVYGKYATLDSLIEKTRPVLNDNGLAIVQFPAVSELGQPVLRTVILHAESSEQLTADTPLFLQKQDMQGLGSAITYARRYAWAAALGIATDTDDDGQHASQKTAAPNPVAAAEPAQVADSGNGDQISASEKTQGEFRFATGKNAGKTLAECPRDYLTWYLDNGPKQDVKEAIGVFLALTSEAA